MLIIILIATILDYTGLRFVLLQFHDEVCLVTASPHEGHCRSMSVASEARSKICSRSNGIKHILPLVCHEQVLVNLHFGEFVHHFKILLVNAQHFALPIAEVCFGVGAESSSVVLRRSRHLLCELGLGRVRRGRLVTMEHTCIIDEYIGSSVPD